MTLVTKSTPRLALFKNQQGQISIFFSASLIVLISIVAFVINVGLFVKAKINLQNATDAAAFSGAAVQARQLTKIAYLNWEMRNIYKEWMYKYYVVGNLNINAVANPTGAPPMDFRLEKDTNVLSGEVNEDPYNFPAVCIHLAGSKTNICKRYAIPGLPEFGSYNLPGAEEASRAFIDSLIGTKINDCVDRTRLNALVTSTWAYNVLTSANDVDQTLAGQGPAILADRQGAWPKAVELAIRMRNLEFVVNRPAQTAGVCIQTGNGNATACTKSITDVQAENALGNERLVKAFYAGFRNLGNEIDKEMKNTFTLTELAPKSIPLGGQNSASYLLVPGTNRYEKQYLDLKLMMVNYAVFYAAMIPRASNDTSGACDVSKVAIPVPGYPLGFYKNPDLVTYYAVKGEAEFVGMFNPFSNESIKLTAYSAAKPFGGRIGPMLFVQKENTDYFTGRTDNSKYRSVPYIASLDLVGTKIKGKPTTLVNGEFYPGTPLPINFDSDVPGFFWIKTPQSAVGGLGASAQGVQFGIPNLVYEYEQGFTNSGYQEAGSQIHIIKPADGVGGDKHMGLFSRNQFKAFKGTIGGTVTPDALRKEIERVRAGTTYEAANYMIPTPFEFNKRNDVDSFGWITGNKVDAGNGVVKYTTHVYAPLYKTGDQTDVLYETPNAVLIAIFDFMRNQRNGIDKYKNSLNAGARAVYNMRNVVAGTGAAGTIEKYADSAAGISDIDFSQPAANDSDPGTIPKTCKSIAGQFLSFYYGDQDLFPGVYVKNDGVSNGCPIPLGTMLRTYFTSSTAASGFSASHYTMDYSFKEDNYTKSPAGALGVLSAYMPGPWTGVGEDGRYNSPFPGSGISELMRRNFYSTKLVPLGALRGGAGYSESATNLVIYSEGNLVKQQSPDTTQTSFKNTLQTDVSAIKY